MKKRTIALLLLTALLGILLTSCGEDERNHYSPGYWRDNVFYDAFVDPASPCRTAGRPPARRTWTP